MRPGTCGLEAIKHMVPAQKQPPTTEPEPEISSPPASKGFGKVLSSIQGLQQRLDDFSLEEASQAEQKAQSLIDKLKALQAHLQLFAKLREFVPVTNRAISEIPEANFDLVAPDSLENHPQLRAIIQAGKLIRMHRLLQAARSSAESFSLEFDVSSQASRATGPDSDAAQRASEAFVPQFIADAETPALATQADSIPLNNTAQVGNVVLAPDLTVKPETESARRAETIDAQPGKTAATYDFTDVKLEDFPQPAPRREPSAAAATKPVGTRAAGAKKDKTAPNKSHFDERLLSDLIDTYGEFVLSSAPSKPIEPTPEPAKTLAVRTDSIEQSLAVPSVALVPVNADSAALPALPVPQDQDEEEKVADVDAFIPSIKNRSEIDRQLKSIIKDYGEYDLYSHSKPSKFNKTAAIAAFVVLGLVLGGFYLFKSPPARTPAAAENTAPAQATSKSPSNPTPDEIKQQNP